MILPEIRLAEALYEAISGHFEVKQYLIGGNLLRFATREGYYLGVRMLLYNLLKIQSTQLQEIVIDPVPPNIQMYQQLNY